MHGGWFYSRLYIYIFLLLCLWSAEMMMMIRSEWMDGYFYRSVVVIISGLK